MSIDSNRYDEKTLARIAAVAASEKQLKVPQRVLLRAQRSGAQQGATTRVIFTAC